jgi:hypothetical protein
MDDVRSSCLIIVMTMSFMAWLHTCSNQEPGTILCLICNTGNTSRPLRLGASVATAGIVREEQAGSVWQPLLAVSALLYIITSCQLHHVSCTP